MRQWLGVSANAALNTRWTQFINHANYIIIDSNVMDWANVIKTHTPPSAKRYFPPLLSMCCTNIISWPGMHSCPQRPRSFWCWPKGNGRTIESHCWHRTAWWKCLVPVSLTLNMNAWDASCLLVINAQCLNKTMTLRDRQPVKALHTARLVTGI